MAGGKPHGSNPKTMHEARDRHQRIAHAEKQEARRTREPLPQVALCTYTARDPDACLMCTAEWCSRCQGEQDCFHDTAERHG